MPEPSAKLYAIMVSHAARQTIYDPAFDRYDLVQEAFARGWAAVAAKPEVEQIRYLCTVVSHLAIDLGRRRKFRAPMQEEWTNFPGAHTIEGECLDRLELLAVCAAPRLGLRETLLNGAGYTYHEIAGIVGVNNSTVHTRIYRYRHPEGGAHARHEETPVAVRPAD
jgi:DNA-directed RNA polymerase specialized sigma24 family protein